MRLPYGIMVFICTVFLSYGAADKFFDTKALLKVEPENDTSMKADDGWYKDAVFYHLWIKGFADSNGDGVGDLQGIINKLDYLNDGNPATKNDLGITAIWLSPVFDCDYKGDNMHGYDTVDYYKINPLFGTNADLDMLLKEAHKRGIRIIFDYIPNHVSDKHSWFLDAKAGGPKKKWFIWEKKPSTEWHSAWGGGSWRNVWHPWKGEFYYGAFWKGMPDINFRNKDARTAMTNVLIYWLNKGFDGVRMDAVRYLYENGPGKGADQPETHEFFKKTRTLIDGYTATGYAKMAVCEAWSDVNVIKDYYGNGHNEFNMAFDFPLVDIIRNAVASGSSSRVKEIGNYILQEQKLYPEGFRNATFLNNHDEAADRPGTLYKGDAAKIKLAGALSLLLPGTPFIYYGTEFGMKDGEMSGDIRHRTNVDWSEEAKQGSDPASIFSEYRNLINVRTTHEAIRDGDFTVVKTDNDKVLAFTRSSAGDKMLVVFNFNATPVNVALTIEGTPTLVDGTGTPDSNGIKQIAGTGYGVFLVK